MNTVKACLTSCFHVAMYSNLMFNNIKHKMIIQN